MTRLIDLPEMIVRDVAELPDRTSPDDQPEMMLVTSAELDRIVTDRIADLGCPRDAHGAPLDENGVRFQNAALDDENKQLRQALNEVVTNGEWTEGEQYGDWKISKEVYETARDALAGAEDHPVAGWPA